MSLALKTIRTRRYDDNRKYKLGPIGDGPLSGNKGYWLGCRYLPSSSYTDYTALRNALNLQSPKGFDLTNLWYPMGVNGGSPTDWYGTASMTETDAWNWMRGGTDDDYTKGESVFIPTGGPTATGNTVMRRGQWPRLYDTFLNVPCALLIALCPPQRKTDLGSSKDPYLWHELARGDYDSVPYGLGRRFAYRDSVYGRPVFPAAGERFGTAHTLIEVGWEIDSAQSWSFWDAVTPSSPPSGYPASSYTRDVVFTAIERWVTNFKAGYYSFDGWSGSPAQRNCPYWFGTRMRQAAPIKTGKSMKDIFWSVANPGILNYIGASQHDNRDSQSNPCSPTTPRGNWLDKNNASAVQIFEGLNSHAELCDKHGWKIFNNETSTHFEGGYTGGDYPDLFYQSTHDFFRTHPNIAGGFSWFYGDGSPDILNNPDPTATSGPATRHALAKQVILNLYKR